MTIQLSAKTRELYDEGLGTATSATEPADSLTTSIDFGQMVKIATSEIGSAAYKWALGRDAEKDKRAVKGITDYVKTATQDPATATKDIGKAVYKWALGRDFDSDAKATESWKDYLSRVSQDPSIAVKDLGKYLWRKIAGKTKVAIDSQLSEYTRKVLSDEIDFEVADQETLHKLSGGKYKDRKGNKKKILGLYVNGKRYLDKEVAADEGLRCRTLLHEQLESVTHRDDCSNDEQEHVAIELATEKGLRHYVENAKGEIQRRAYKALGAFYKTIKAGAEAGDDLCTKVQTALGGSRYATAVS